MLNTLISDGLLAQGIMIATVGWLIVFVALIILVIIFMNTPKLMQLQFKNRFKRKFQKEVEGDIHIDSNVNAAIATAIYLYFQEEHDNESNVITIKNAKKEYSPWSSKIYGVQNRPTK